MEKIQGFFKKNRNLFLFIFCLAFFCVTFFFHYTENIRDIQGDPVDFYSITETGEKKVHENILSPGNTLKQEFSIAPGDYKYISIQFATFMRENKGILDVTLTGKNIGKSWAISCEDIKDNEYHLLPFDEKYQVSEGEVLSLTIVSKTQSSELSPTIYTTEKATGESQKDNGINDVLFINGERTYESLRIAMSSGLRSFAGPLYALICVASLLGLTLIYIFFAKKKQIKVENVTAFIALALGIAYMFVFTPFSIPDEPVHYMSAYHYSNILTLHFDDEANALQMRADDYAMSQRTSTGLSAKEYYKIGENASLFAEDTSMQTTTNDPITTRPLAYLSSGLGMAIGRVLNLGAYPVYYLGRLFNLLSMVGLLYFSIKKMPFGKVALSTIALLPMTLHLSGSYSYDTYTISFCMLLFAQLVNLIYSKQKISAKTIAFTVLLSLLAVPYKMVYITIAALALLIPKDCFKSKKQHFIVKTGIVVAGVIGIIYLQLSTILSLTNPPETVLWANEVKYSLGQLITNPTVTIALFYRTFISTGAWYLGTLIGNSLGWFQVSLSWVMVVLFCLLLFVSFIKKEDEPRALTPLSKWYTFALTCGTVFFVMFVLLLDWTPITSNTILGVQGRYFILALPLLFLVVRNNTIVLKQSLDKYILFSAVMLNVYALLRFFIQIISA